MSHRSPRSTIAAAAVTLVAVLLGACAPGSGASPSLSPSSVASDQPTSEPTRTPLPTATPAPGVVAAFDLGISPSGILVAGDYVWAEDHSQANAVFALDPSTGDSVMTVHVERPCDLAMTEGLLWIADLGAGEMLSVDLTSGEVAARIGGLHGPCGVQAVGGAVWSAVDEGLARIDVATGELTTTSMGGAAFPGAGKPLWVNIYGTAQVARVETASGEVGELVELPGGATEEMPVAAGFGSVWVGHGLGNRLYRLDPRSGEIQAEIEVTRPTRLLIAEGGVWLTSYPGGVVERVDPATNAVVYHAELGGTPNGIAAGFGAIWVADTSLRHLYRIDPAATSVAD